MRIILVILCIILCIVLIVSFRPNQSLLAPVDMTIQSNPSAQTPFPPPNAIEYVDQGVSYSASWISVDDPKKLSLYVNSKKHTINDFKKMNNCNSITSGGFYDTTGKPLGLFISEGQTIQPFRLNLLLNGVFSVRNNDAVINNQPIDGATIALQSGPQLFKNGKPLLLAIKNDESARRVVIVITQDEHILLVVFYQTDNTYLGPFLQSLPRHVSIFQTATNIAILDALNLDGGSASSFVTDDVSISQLTPIGSFFCVRS